MNSVFAYLALLVLTTYGTYLLSAFAYIAILAAVSSSVYILASMVKRTRKPLPPGRDPAVVLLESIRDNRWTRFYDMSSTGGSKHTWDVLIIEYPVGPARNIFWYRFGHDPYGVSSKDGYAMDDYFITEHNTFEEAAEGVDMGSALVILKHDVSPHELIYDGELDQNLLGEGTLLDFGEFEEPDVEWPK